MPRLSKKQKSLLEEMGATPEIDGKRIPLYVENWSRAESFYSEGERLKFLKNMESRGLFRIENYFLHLL